MEGLISEWAHNGNKNTVLKWAIAVLTKKGFLFTIFKLSFKT